MLPFELTKDTPYLALSGELWSVFYEYFNRNWSCYKGFLLYLYIGCKYASVFLIIFRKIEENYNSLIWSTAQLASDSRFKSCVRGFVPFWTPIFVNF